MRRPGDSPPEPFPFGSPTIPSYEALQKQFETRMPVRALMPIHPDGLHWWVPNSEGPVTNDAILQCFGEVQSTARSFLETVWYARRGADTFRGRISEDNVLRGAAKFEEMVQVYVGAVTDVCCRPGPCPRPPAPQPLPASADSAQWNLAFIALIYKAVWCNRARVWPTQDRDSSLSFVSDGFPGIIWAEILNVAMAKPLWASLRVCAWCGRFTIVEARGPGRPREFCSHPCRIRFHDYGPADRRTYGPRSHY